MTLEILSLVILMVIVMPITIYYSVKAARFGWLQANRRMQEEDSNK